MQQKLLSLCMYVRIWTAYIDFEQLYVHTYIYVCMIQLWFLLITACNVLMLTSGGLETAKHLSVEYVVVE